MRLKIVQAGEPVLRAQARRLTRDEITSEEIQRLIRDMRETMRDAPGVGLAAPQVGVPLRLIVIEKTPDNEPIVLANPEIVKAVGRRRITEGCLSIPGYQGELFRSEQVTVKGIGRDGKE